MQQRNKFRFGLILRDRFVLSSGYSVKRGTIKILGNIETPAWNEPWDAELGIPYRGENGRPVYYTGNGIETEDDIL